MRRLRPRLAAPAWVAAMSVGSAPSPIATAPGLPGGPSWLDGSWAVGLDLANLQHLSMGSRVLFTYGPYGYVDLTFPFFWRTWAVALAATLAIHVALVGCVAVLLRRAAAGWVAIAAVSLAILLFLRAIAAPDLEGALLAALAGTLALQVERPRHAAALAAIAGAALALLVLVKATGLVIVAGLLPVLVTAALLRHRAAVAAMLAGTFAVAFGLLWWGAGMGAADLPRYVESSLVTASGYASAQAVGGVTVWLIVGALIVLVVAIAAVAAVVRRRTVPAAWLLASTVILFAVFKDTFIRNGPDRDVRFFGEVALIAVLTVTLLALELPRGRAVRLAVAFTVPLMALAIGYRLTDPSVFQTLPRGLRDWATAAHSVVDSSIRRNLEAEARASAQREYGPVIAAAALPRGSTVDFMGSDVGFFYAATDLAWDPRPVLQSYQAYAPWLDRQDAEFLAGPGAPEYVLYRWAGLDFRYAVWDEPETMRTLLRRYRLVKAVDEQTLLLRRMGISDQQPERGEGRACAPMGRPISIPQVPGRLLFGRLEMGFTLWGRLLDLAGKPAQVRVELRTALESRDHPLVWQVAADGVYLSTLAENGARLAGVFGSGDPGEPITSVTVSSNAAWEWSSPVCLDLFSVEVSR